MILKIAEIYINKAIQTDINAYAYLQNLNNLEILILPNEYPVYISFNEKSIKLSKNPTLQQSSIIIDNKAVDWPFLLILWLSQNNIKDFQCQGDVVHLRNIQRFIYKLKIDWVTFFEMFIGQIPAYYLQKKLKQLKKVTFKFYNHSINHSINMLSDYFKYENPQWVSADEITAFNQDIDHLLDDIERLKTRYQWLVDKM